MGAAFDTLDLSQDYPRLLDDLRVAPVVESRGGRTREIMDFSLVLRDPTRCLVDRDSVSRRFMDAEIAMLLAGVYDGELLQAITPKAAELTTPLTAYGPRVRRQLLLTLIELGTHQDSRRAVVYVGKPDDLETIGPDTAGEMPCTMTWQFLIRPDEEPWPRLHMLVNMRSWDAVWGLSYDVPCFVAVQMAMARSLALPLGTYRHHAASLHLYEQHWQLQARAGVEQLSIPWITSDLTMTMEQAEHRVKAMRVEVLGVAA